MSLFGSLVTPYDIEARVLAFVEKWLPTYLAEVERQTGTAAREIARPGTYRVTRDTSDNWPEDTPPAVLVKGTPGDAEVSPSGVGYWFTFEVATVADGIDEDDAHRIAQFYTTAVQALIVQNGALDGLSEDTLPDGMEFTDLGDDARTLARGVFTFRAFVPELVNPSRGPTSPDPKPDPDEPYGDLPTVSGVDITVEGLPPSD